MAAALTLQESATESALRDELARWRRKAEVAESELRTERWERAEHLKHTRARLTEEIGQAYRTEAAKLREQLAAYARTHLETVAALKAEFAAKEQAYEAKLRDLSTKLAIYQRSGPARTGSEKFSNSLANKKTPKRRSKHGGGRKIPTDLPVETVEHKLPWTACPDCGEQLRQAEPSVFNEVDFEIKIKQIRHERQKVVACSCGWCGPCDPPPQPPAEAPVVDTAPDTPMSGTDCAVADALVPTSVNAVSAASRTDLDAKPQVKPRHPYVRAAAPPKAMAGAMFSDRALIEILVLKYGYQISLYQIIDIFCQAGYKPSDGTLSDSLQRLTENFLNPLDTAIVDHLLAEKWWAADASSLRVIEPGQKRTHGVVWQIRSTHATVYRFTRTGHARHIQNFFQPVTDTARTLLVDRAATFKTLAFIIAFCWAHVRRDFIRLGLYKPGHRTFADHWLGHIAKLFKLCSAWHKEPDNPSRLAAIDQHLQLMVEERDAELAKEELPELRRKVLQSLANHWHGLTRFRDDIRIPMDNNAVERSYRDLARLRRNSQACHSAQGAKTAMTCFTVIQTLEQNQIAVKPYLLAWMEAIAFNGGKVPADISPWLPWQLSADVKTRIAHFQAT